ncbi:MAG: hypothetical protein HY351_00010 [Candidatus Omnitrophica bacterium]|nr:hypothetical protein [Candidatus Omnitrophota bacterium]
MREQTEEQMEIPEGVRMFLAVWFLAVWLVLLERRPEQEQVFLAAGPLLVVEVLAELPLRLQGVKLLLL